MQPLAVFLICSLEYSFKPLWYCVIKPAFYKVSDNIPTICSNDA